MMLRDGVLFAVLLSGVLSGCSSQRTDLPGQYAEPVLAEQLEAFRAETAERQRLAQVRSLADIPPLDSPAKQQTPPLSPGDRVRISITEGDEFSGLFEVNLDGHLHLPYLSPQPVLGKSLSDVEALLAKALVDEGFFQPDFARVSVKPLQWAPVPVTVAGAVFQPGRVMVNNRPVAVREFQNSQESGDASLDRNLTAALRSAGGVRPDADIANITLIRNGKQRTVNVSGIFTGRPVDDFPLIAGDQVIVPSIGYMQTEYARPSQITPPGFKVFLSNLSVPAPNNSSASISKGSIDMPYGSTMLHGLIAANCVGGTKPTNASREAVLVTTNRMTGELKVIERSIERMVRHPNRSEFNPVLMPNDGIACYDSDVTSVRDVARSLSDVLSPLSLLSNVLLLNKLLTDTDDDDNN